MSLLSGFKNKVFGTAPKLKKRVFDPEKISIEDISLPTTFRAVEVDQLKEAILEEITTFKSMDYKNHPLEQLKDPEYHSYQIGLLLRYIQKDLVYFIPEPKDVLPSDVLYITKKQLHIKVFNIVHRYDNEIKKDALKEEMATQYEWAPIDAAYLLRYLSLENRRLTKKN